MLASRSSCLGLSGSTVVSRRQLARVLVPERHHTRGRAPEAVARTAYSFESRRLLKCILTRQAIKTTLNYLSETNGELHFYLHNYWADNPLVVDPAVDADEWLVKLATTPLTKVQDPRRSSVVTAAAAAAVLNGEREVSPRELAERIMRLREHIAAEMAEDLGAIREDNVQVQRRTLSLTFHELSE
ncbi:hypothetical protein HYH03_002236 [Edaphochlamys debaryana]|uniref:Uncharacterized protein n=1 Tax=Edaphochlamys debaryana TaxID=47281 RepID=A0A835YC84_9CHLO|nr:hypothetical protein HYH03_002236 [Edaphochlamys debaryana]|eukprot:KAG2499951.1 hypothetical protein HYH03_002236 [Edaphochlamys debaryana]